VTVIRHVPSVGRLRTVCKRLISDLQYVCERQGPHQ
jgi:hypothetical protein